MWANIFKKYRDGSKWTDFKAGVEMEIPEMDIPVMDECSYNVDYHEISYNNFVVHSESHSLKGSFGIKKDSLDKLLKKKSNKIYSIDTIKVSR